jgi:hypothetical protein
MAMPRPPSPVRLIWLSATCPKITPRIEPIPHTTTEAHDEISDASA